MDKFLMRCFMVVLLISANVKAAPVSVQTVDANAIMTKAQQQMNNMMVYGIEVNVNDAALLDIAVDKNKKIIYANMCADGVTTILWGDGNTQMEYMYDSESKQYYFVPGAIDFSELEKESEETLNAVKTDTSVAYTYVGTVQRTVKNQTFECYQIQASASEQGMSSVCEYYVSREDGKIRAMDMTISSQQIMTDIKMQMNFYYPESLSVPEEVIASATISPGYQVKKGKVIYTIKYIKNQPVFMVTGEEKAKNAVKIEDSIVVSGKSYPVYGINEYAFYGNNKIKSVTIGKNVQVIGKKAFYNCKKLSMVRVKSKKLKKVEKQVFKTKGKMVTIKVPAKKLKQYKKLFNKSKSKVYVTK